MTKGSIIDKHEVQANKIKILLKDFISKEFIDYIKNHRDQKLVERIKKNNKEIYKNLNIKPIPMLFNDISDLFPGSDGYAVSTLPTCEETDSDEAEYNGIFFNPDSNQIMILPLEVSEDLKEETLKEFYQKVKKYSFMRQYPKETIKASPQEIVRYVGLKAIYYTIQKYVNSYQEHLSFLLKHQVHEGRFGFAGLGWLVHGLSWNIKKGSIEEKINHKYKNSLKIIRKHPLIKSYISIYQTWRVHELLEERNNFKAVRELLKQELKHNMQNLFFEKILEMNYDVFKWENVAYDLRNQFIAGDRFIKNRMDEIYSRYFESFKK